MAALVYLSLSGMAPVYLAADCQLVSDEGRRRLRSAKTSTATTKTDAFPKTIEPTLAFNILGGW